MRVVLQRVTQAAVTVEEKIVGEIKAGLLILVGIADEDHAEDINWLCQKIINLRIFLDQEGIMNRSIKEIDGEILVISQFTLHAKTKKGNRPSYIKAARPEIAIPLYEKFKTALAMNLGKPIETGIFGAAMQVSLVNDGPVTLIIDSKVKE
jgi:D-tyrosyl-tRNA(Tyr) deacylase